MTTDINKAVAALQKGELVAFPTETVYGLGADARNELAISKVFTLKERPTNHPLIVHIADEKDLQDWALEVSPIAQQLARAFWPGPLTLIFKKRPDVLGLLTGGQETIALRVPQHPLAQALLQGFGGGIAAPSANKFTHISPTTADAVYEEFGDKVSVILDGGACAIGLESTIIDVAGNEPVILRPGMLSAKAVSEVIGYPIEEKNPQKIHVPGAHHLHYAPRTKTSLIEEKNICDFLQQLRFPDFPVVLMIRSAALKETCLHEMKTHIYWVDMPSIAKDYAHDLYRTLRVVDRAQFQHIIIEDVPHDAEWAAIRDRLVKASGSAS